MSKRAAASSNTPTESKRSKQSSLSGFFKSKSAPSEDKFRLLCDLDGVLCDFDAGVAKIFHGKLPHELPHKGTMWQRIAQTNDFYANLPWTRDGQALWNAIQHLTPDILTGVPRANEDARTDKAAWCRRHLHNVEINHVDMAGPKTSHRAIRGRKQKDMVNVITCWTVNKYMESGPKAILIDDNKDLAEKWELRGGTFVHHTSTEDTMRRLKEIGVLPKEDNEMPTEEAAPKPLSIEEEVAGEEEPLFDLPPDTP